MLLFLDSNPGMGILQNVKCMWWITIFCESVFTHSNANSQSANSVWGSSLIFSDTGLPHHRSMVL